MLIAASPSPKWRIQVAYLVRPTVQNTNIQIRDKENQIRFSHLRNCNQRMMTEFIHQLWKEFNNLLVCSSDVKVSHETFIKGVFAFGEENKKCNMFFLYFLLSVGNEEDVDWFHPGGVSESESPGRGPPWPDTDQILSPSLMTLYPKLRVIPLRLDAPPTHDCRLPLVFWYRFLFSTGSPTPPRWDVESRQAVKRLE